MDEHVSMEERRWVTVSGYGPIPVPQTIEEWMCPTMYVGQDINWYMVQPDLNKYVPPDMVNQFYYCDENRKVFEHLVSVTSDSEYLNLICNSCHHITDHHHQQWLMSVMNASNCYRAEFMITDMPKNTPEDNALRQLRNSIWQLIR